MAVTECLLYKHGGGTADVISMGYPRKSLFRSEPRKPAQDIYTLTEYEVKVTKSDLCNDLKKHKWTEWGVSPPVTHFYYAVPRELAQEAFKAALDLEDMLRGKKEFFVSKKAFLHNPISRKFKVGVIAFDSEFRWEITRKAVRVLPKAPDHSINRVIARSFNELHSLRDLQAFKENQEALESLRPGDVWESLKYSWKNGKNRRRKVRILHVFDNYVQYENLETSRKSKSKVAGFSQRFRLHRGKS